MGDRVNRRGVVGIRVRQVVVWTAIAAYLWIFWSYQDNWRVLVASFVGILALIGLLALVQRKLEKDAPVLPTGARVGDPAAVSQSPPPPHSAAALIPGHVDAVAAVGFGAGGRLLAVGGGNAVVLWDVTDQTGPIRVATLAWTTGVTVVSVAFSPDGHVLAAGSDDQSVTLWRLDDPATPARIATLPVPRYRWNDTGCAIDFSPDGRLLVTADRAAILWDVTDPAHPIRKATLPLLRRWLAEARCAVAFSGDGRVLATASRSVVSLWDVTDPARPHRFTTLRPQGRGVPGTGTVTMHAVSFSPDGRLLATAGISRVDAVNESAAYSSSASSVALWDVTEPARPTRTAVLAERGSNQAEPKLRASAPTFVGHEGTVWSLRFSPTTPLLATAGDDGVLLWDVTDQARPHPIAVMPENRAALAVAFAPDGELLATGSTNRRAAVWRIPPTS